MALCSPRLIRKNRIQPENSDDSIAWSESDAHELLGLPSVLNDTVDFLPKTSAEKSTVIASKCAIQKEFDRKQNENLDQLQKRERCICLSNLPWILITNSLLQVSLFLSLLIGQN